MRISDWSSDVCSSDLRALLYQCLDVLELQSSSQDDTLVRAIAWIREWRTARREHLDPAALPKGIDLKRWVPDAWYRLIAVLSPEDEPRIHRKYLELFIRSEEHTSELQSLMRN